MARYYTDEDELYKDVVQYGRVDGARRGVVIETGNIANACSKPRRPKGSCFKCDSMEHQSQTCPTRRKEEVPDNTTHLLGLANEVVPSYQIEAKVDIGNKYISLNPILDTGSPISLIRENLVQNMTLDSCSSLNYEGINKSKLKILGVVNVGIVIEDEYFRICLNVVTSDTMQYDCLLGRNFTANPRIKLTFSDTLELEIVNTNVEQKTEENNIFLIDLDYQNNSIVDDLKINPEIDSYDNYDLITMLI